MSTKGLAIVENVPKNMDGLPKLIESVFSPEVTHYGDYFRVEQKFDANNVAYTGATIGLHQDLSFYEKPPGVFLNYITLHFHVKINSFLGSIIALH